VFEYGPYSVHFTAGLDTVVPGDGKGMNLNNNPAAQTLVRRIGNLGEFKGKLPVQHEIASHGGWDHDIYGDGATETNANIYLPYLEKNFAAVDAIRGKASTEYSAPQGNNPIWALDWMQSKGVVGYYYVGDVGAGATRAYRDGKLQHPNMWAFPVTPFGIYATFEEFEENSVTDAMTLDWLSKLQDFVVNNRTTRMFYNHPPGALGHLDGVVVPMLQRSAKLKSTGKFQWYTMTQFAQFQARRNQTVWDINASGRSSKFQATNPISLADVTWVLPKTRYLKPVSTLGKINISENSTEWVVIAGDSKSITFTAPNR
jgi:hypothetical protein